jgi:hypothetical protein
MSFGMSRPEVSEERCACFSDSRSSKEKSVSMVNVSEYYKENSGFKYSYIFRFR